MQDKLQCQRKLIWLVTIIVIVIDIGGSFLLSSFDSGVSIIIGLVIGAVVNIGYIVFMLWPGKGRTPPDPVQTFEDRQRENNKLALIMFVSLLLAYLFFQGYLKGMFSIHF